jgi:carboxyl-terminal processing protease
VRPSQHFLAGAIVAALAGCGSSSTDPEELRKSAVLSAVRSWYLFLDLLPADGDPLADPKRYSTADELLDALTSKAREQGKDRNWSYLVTKEQYESYYQRGENAGFGFSLQIKGSLPAQQLFVSQVFAGSPAASAGFKRGDEILAVGPDAEHLTPVANVPNDGSLGALFQSSTAGSARVFSVRPVGGAAVVTRSAAAGAYDVDPVPAHAMFGTTGYVSLRTFIAPADPLLRAAFADLKAKGAKNMVVDLRYNGGGYVSTAQLLASLLGGDLNGRTMFRQQFNAAHGDNEQSATFSAEPEAGAFERVAFITTRASASASELVPNALDPYLKVAFVGERTHGKPVGQLLFELTDLDRELFLISFKLSNSAGNADYFGGLPDASSIGPLCPAADDLAHAQDSADEASTKTALYFAEHGSCPMAATGALRAAAAHEAVDYPRVERSTPAQVDMPGLF